MKKTHVVSALILAITLAAVPSAFAANKYIISQNYSPIKCTPGWFFSGRFLRYSTGSVYNESAENFVWVTCPLDSLALGNINILGAALIPIDLGDYDLAENTDLTVGVLLKNDAAEKTSITCQVKTYDANGNEVGKTGKTVPIFGGETKEVIIMGSQPFNLLEGNIADVTCNLPPSSVMLRYFTEIGYEQPEV